MHNSILAIDIGGTMTKLALVDPEGNTGQVISIPSTNEYGVDNYLSDIVGKAGLLLGDLKEDVVVGIGIGVAGFVDPAHTMMTFNPNLDWLEGVPLKDFFSSQFDLPVFIEIDSNAAALAEAIHGGGKTSQRLLVLSIGTGVGGGMVIDGEVLRIANECLGDIGHVIVEPGGMQCSVGCRGCAEAMVSAPALEKYAAEFMADDQSSLGYPRVQNGEKIKTPEIIQAAHQGDSAAKKAIQKIGNYLGIAIASMVPILVPDQISIAGGISEAGELFLKATESSFLKIAGSVYSKQVKLQKATFGWQSVLVGAAAAQRSVSNLI
jgi:glucokinase